jgi:HD-GYP domain-containing protein (c-di-GMP phosphodiesterase class II)
MNNTQNNLKKLIDIGIALSKEKNINILLEKILNEARVISNSDGGTVYLVIEEGKKLNFEIMHTESLNIKFGGSSNPVPDAIYPVKIYNDDGTKNVHNVAAVCALEGKTINIDDAYTNKEYDFSGTKGFDEKNNYRSKSFLTIPLKNHKDKVIGVLQLINSKKDDEIINFSNELVDLVEALSSQASVALTNQLLIDEQKQLFRSFIKLVAEALEKKDLVTGGHCNRVPVLTMMIAEEINSDKTGLFKNFMFSDDELDELYVAGWLHDFGKVATPEYIMNKSTKLEGLYDKIDEIKFRFEILKRDIKLEYYKNLINKKGLDNHREFDIKLDDIDNDLKFLEKSNLGGEFMDESLKQRIKEIAQQHIVINGKSKPILDDEEIDFLTISRGTLSANDRKIMEDHVVLTYDLLSKLPYPDHLKEVPFYAGCHHEKINGKGYPNGYSGDKLPIQARIIAIADVFEGLTAPDRPYKKGYKLSKALGILKYMVNDGEIDEDLFNLFITKKLYLKYANEMVAHNQIDDINEKELLG